MEKSSGISSDDYRIVNFFKWGLGSIREKGVKSTVQSFLSVIGDVYHEKKYGTETSEIIEVEDLDISEEEKAHAVRYKPTRIRHFKKMLSQLNLPEDGVFVDFGSGKGKVLLAASDYNFKRVVGIELSSQLCEIAGKNIATYEKKLKRSSGVEIVHANVLDYEIQDDENVFYFFRPFDNVIMEKIIGNIETSHKKNPRKIWLIINSSIYDELFETRNVLKRSLDYEYGGMEFVVYTSQ